MFFVAPAKYGQVLQALKIWIPFVTSVTGCHSLLFACWEICWFCSLKAGAYTCSEGGDYALGWIFCCTSRHCFFTCLAQPMFYTDQLSTLTLCLLLNALHLFLKEPLESRKQWWSWISSCLWPQSRQMSLCPTTWTELALLFLLCLRDHSIIV